MNATRGKFIVVGPFSLLFLTACISTTFRPTQNFETVKLSAVSPTSVRVLRSPPHDAFLPLGEIETYISGIFTFKDITRKAQERAATIGADAIIINSDTLWAEPGGVLDVPSDEKLVYVRYTAIRFLRGESSQRNP